MKKVLSVILVATLMLAICAFGVGQASASEVDIADTGVKSASVKSVGGRYDNSYNVFPGFTVKESSTNHREFVFSCDVKGGNGVTSDKVRIYASLGDNHSWVRLSEVSSSVANYRTSIFLDEDFFEADDTAGNLARYGNTVKVYFTIRGYSQRTGNFNTSYHTNVYFTYNTKNFAPTIRPTAAPWFSKSAHVNNTMYHQWTIDTPWIASSQRDGYLIKVYYFQNGSWKTYGYYGIDKDNSTDITIDALSGIKQSNGDYALTARITDKYGNWESCFLGYCYADYSYARPLLSSNV